MILVIDERKGAMLFDMSNVDIEVDEFERLLERAQSGTEASVIIRIQQDGVYASSGDEVATVVVKSEAEMSLEKAGTERKARTGDTPTVDKAVAAEDVLAKFKKVWEQPSNSGTAEITGK